jgi:hypothetical protein
MDLIILCNAIYFLSPQKKYWELLQYCYFLVTKTKVPIL